MPGHMPSLCHRLDVARAVVQGVPHPGRAVAADFYGNAADFSQQASLLFCPADGHAGATEQLHGPVTAGQRQLCQLPVCHVPGGTDDAFELARRVKHRVGMIVNPAHLAAGVQDAVLLVQELALTRALAGIDQHRLVFWQHGIQVSVLVDIQAVATAAPNFFVSRADVEDFPGVGIAAVEHVLNVFCHLSKTCLAVAQGGFCLGPFQCNAGQPDGGVEYVDVPGLWHARRVVVDGKSSQHGAVC